MEEQASCPFNLNHKFNRDQLVHHLSRCKDRKKVQHLYAKCRFNSTHFFLKADIANHEQWCQDREEHLKLSEQLQQAERQADLRRVNEKKERSRSRQRERSVKSQKDEQQSEDEDIIMEKCLECNELLRQYLNTNPPKDDRIMKLLDEYKKI